MTGRAPTHSKLVAIATCSLSRGYKTPSERQCFRATCGTEDSVGHRSTRQQVTCSCIHCFLLVIIIGLFVHATAAPASAEAAYTIILGPYNIACVGLLHNSVF